MLNELLFSLRERDEVAVLATDAYTLKEGLYICLNGDTYQELFIEKNKEYSGDLYEFIKARDFYSSLTEMNKPIDMKKKIHSNNIFTLFFKVPDIKKLKDGQFNIWDLLSCNQHIERYYDYLLKWYGSNREILDNAQLRPFSQSKIIEIKDYIISRLKLIQERVMQNNVKAGKYIKVFCEAAIEDYMHASNLYLIPKIFNKNDYNIKIGERIFGLSNFNMGTNSKKPFLEHKTTAYTVPFRINLEDALDSYRLSTWLNSQNIEGKSIDSGYLTFEKDSGCYLKQKINSGEAAQYIHFIRGKTGPEIDDYEILPQPRKEMDRPLKVLNYLRLPKYDIITIKKVDELERIIDEYFFNGNMIRGYYYSPSIKEGYFTSKHSSLLHMYRDAFISFFLKFDDSSFRRILDKCTLELVIEQLKLSNTIYLETTRFAKALNFRLALLEYYEIGGKKEMGSIVNDTFDRVKSKADMNEPKTPLSCETDEEFYFVAGQLARYLLSLSRAQKISYSLLNPLLKADNSSRVKDEIKKLIQKYGYDIEVWSSGMRSRFDNLQCMVNSYICESRPMTDMLLAGFAAPNIIYMKKEEGK